MLRGQSDSLYVFSKPAMGTLFQLHFYAEKEVNPELIAEKVFERIIHLDYVLSDYKEDAEVYQLNIRQPLEWQDISAELGFVLENSIKWSKISGHFFDPALGSLTHLWRRARRRNEFPADSLQSMAKNNVGIQHIALRKKDNQYQFKFKKKGVKLDFGGIGKGYAVDEALKICKQLGIRSAMISAGSSLAVGKAPPLKKGWLIKPDTALFSFAQNRYIKHTTQSISGDQQQFLEWEGKRYSHLLHPLTGKPLTEGTTCLVEGPDGLITDALGTAFSLMDQEGMKRILLFRKRIKVICKRGNQLIDIHWKNK
ncbi:MAG: FAD:protein FMN transferase [Bacteroidota bacterium]